MNPRVVFVLGVLLGVSVMACVGFEFGVKPILRVNEALETQIFDLKAENYKLSEEILGYENNETVKALREENARLFSVLVASAIHFNVTTDGDVIQIRFALNGRAFSTSGSDAAGEINWAIGVSPSNIHIGAGNYSVTRPINVTRSFVGIYGSPDAWIYSNATPGAFWVHEDTYYVTLSGLQINGNGIIGGEAP